jgi:hypothetical protein
MDPATLYGPSSQLGYPAAYWFLVLFKVIRFFASHDTDDISGSLESWWRFCFAGKPATTAAHFQSPDENRCLA